MNSFIARVARIDFMADCPAIIKLEGTSVDECVIDKYGYVANVEHDSTIYMTARQLGLEGLVCDNDLKFKVTVERVE